MRNIDFCRFVAAVLMLATAVLLGPLARAQQGAIPILHYYNFDLNRVGPTTVTTSVFEEQLIWLRDHDYTVVPLSMVIGAFGQGRSLDPKSVAITVDDGWKSQFTLMFPIIRRYNLPVTLFVYTDAISAIPAALTWDEISEMQDTGLVEVQSHTCSHPDFLLHRRRSSIADYEAFVAHELQQSKSTLEAHLHRPVTLLAWPYGIVDRRLEIQAQCAGYLAAFSVEQRRALAGADLFALPRLVVSDKARGAAFATLIKGSPEASAGAAPTTCDSSLG